MTRMAFGLNVAPKIMTKILDEVLSLDEQIKLGTDHYVDDIFVNERVVAVKLVKELLLKQIVEDASWLRKADDGSHINAAELDAVLKGINLALKWNLRHTHVYTDSVTVQAWVNSVVLNTHRPKVTGHSEMIVRRRLGLITQLVDEYSLTVDINLVRSVKNCADQLTRVEKKWLARDMPCVSVAVEQNVESENVVQQIHNVHQLGVARTFYLAKRGLGTDVSFETVEKVVKQCLTCRRIDPAPIKWEKGNLEVSKIWHRLAADITHYKNVLHLTLIDCGPSRFAMWAKLRNETAEDVSAQLARIFGERGAPAELLSDNGLCFRSAHMASFLQKWNVTHIFSCAYHASGEWINRA
ncbi:uncharacterized protein [Watersipora subatra]|uniref:uncharacterized protein n=1 Tax=Watersipora subatra TaxID=2589382 RepID=UPI00355C4B71